MLMTRHSLGNSKSRTIEPPHVVAAGIDELDLEIVYGRVRAQIERDLVVLRQIERQLAARERVARDVPEIEVEAQRLSVDAVVRLGGCLTPSEASADHALRSSNRRSKRRAHLRMRHS